MADYYGGVTEGPVWKPQGACAICSCGWTEVYDAAEDAHTAIARHLSGEHGIVV